VGNARWRGGSEPGKKARLPPDAVGRALTGSEGFRMSSETLLECPGRIHVLEAPSFKRYNIEPAGFRGAIIELGREWSLTMIPGIAWVLWSSLARQPDDLWKLNLVMIPFALMLAALILCRCTIIFIQTLTANASILVDDEWLTITLHHWRGDSRIQWAREEIERFVAKQRFDPRSLNPLMPLTFARWFEWVLVVRTKLGEETALFAGHTLRGEIPWWLATELNASLEIT